MDISKYQHSESITIDRPPADVYAIVSDITRMGELSPVCKSGTWEEPSTAGQVGAWFTGSNELGENISWETRCQVITAEPGKAFAFVNHGPSGDVELVQWGYTFEPDGAGTRVTESWRLLPAYPEFTGGTDEADVAARLDGMHQMARDGIATTLANLKKIAES